MADSFNYMMEDMFDNLGFVRVDYEDYGRNMVKDVHVEIHGFTFLVDFVVIGYANEREPLVIFGRDFLVTSKSKVDFGVGEMRIDLTMLEKKGTWTRKKLDEVMMGHARSSSDEFGEKEKMRIVEHVLPKKMLSDARPYNSNLTMADNTQANAMGDPRAKGYLENFEIDEEDDWLSCFEFGRNEDGNPKYGTVSPSLLDIEDEIERALAVEAYFNPFKNIIVFRKLIDFLGLLLIQLKNTDWGNEGYGVYKKIEGNGAWHAKFKVITPSGQKFTRGFKMKETKRKLSRKFTSEDILKFDHFLN
nr:hypothetical protein [Tanacetum cinerariifolium]